MATFKRQANHETKFSRAVDESIYPSVELASPGSHNLSPIASDPKMPRTGVDGEPKKPWNTHSGPYANDRVVRLQQHRICSNPPPPPPVKHRGIGMGGRVQALNASRRPIQARVLAENAAGTQRAAGPEHKRLAAERQKRESRSHAEWEVEGIIDDCIEADTLRHYYLIKWKGWGTKHNTWEPKRNLVKCAEFLQNYHREKKDKMIGNF
ncbi:hypothetical protein DCS_07863 [Drechmeria coniospora]|uniref:Chromo domain-containing protein n=1 Tax=Drechmeria coniospora TaxID=98403 RepID=A0A151GFN1_DRECN|nr:hypothetical protein DCS_07863 [Drechmeria coniospora]KYK55898.1 hypothetical protein DCS_07863 [Drechmeria coniospora]